MVCVDRDHDLDWVVDQGYIQPKYLNRYLHIHADVMELSVEDIWAAVVEKWPTAAWEEVAHVHASPSCRSHSRADRGRSRHRDGQGRPCSALAKADDLACTHVIGLIRALQRRAPAALYTIEQPVNKSFCRVPAVRALRRAPGWRWLTGSYCRMTCELDLGDWPRKDTNFLVHGVGAGFTLPQCADDCKYLLERTEPGRRRRHKVVLCRNRSNWPEQDVITDAMVKGMIPHGAFRLLEGGWRAYRAGRAQLHEAGHGLEGASGAALLTAAAQVLESNACGWAAHGQALHGGVPHSRGHADGCSFVEEAADSEGSLSDEADEAIDAEVEEEEEDASDSEPAGDFADVTRESDFGDDGLRKPKQRQVIKPAVEYGTKPTERARHARFLPGKSGEVFDLHSLEPWELHYTDVIELDFKARGGIFMLLLVADVATGGLRVEGMQRKDQSGEAYDEIAVSEALHRRGIRIVVGADGDGAMRLVKDVARRRGISFLPIPPYSPHLGRVEFAVRHFKECVYSVLLPAMKKDGPITAMHCLFAAKFVCYTLERLPKERVFKSYIGEYSLFVAPWKLNIGTAAKMARLVPFGTPGYAFTDERLRMSRNAPKYLRAEPVVMMGYQHMYTETYECLTRHNTVIRVEQVAWDVDKPLGLFLEDIYGEGGDHGEPAEAGEITIFKNKEYAVPQNCGDDVICHEPAGCAVQAAPGDGEGEPAPLVKAVIRINKEKVYRADGSARPKPYILDRLLEIDGLTAEEAVGLPFKDAKGNSTIYKKKDLAYDMGSWLKIEIEDTDTISDARETSTSLFAHTTAHCAALQVLLAEPTLLQGILDAATENSRSRGQWSRGILRNWRRYFSRY